MSIASGCVKKWCLLLHGLAPREEDGDYLVPHEDVHGLAPREELLAGMATTGENSGVRLLPSVYTAAQIEC
jgi:hypothetical protein